MIIARTSRFIVGVVAVAALLPTMARLLTQPSIYSVIWVLLGISIVRRVAQLAVAVSPDWVIIRNFFRTTHVPVWEAQVEFGEQEAATGLVSDAGGKLDEGGRTLYVRRLLHGDRLHVGVAPRYGKEPVRIHDDLVAAISEARAA